jgi:alcohol dehydrogenase (NADP+)
MKVLKLQSGSELPALGIGTWTLNPSEIRATHASIRHAIEIGYRHIECAMIYGNEAAVGAAIAESINSGTVTREQLWVTSKLWNDSHAPPDVDSALDKTLADLRLDYLDLYLIHWPVCLRKGTVLPQSAADLLSLEQMPLAETWAALEQTVADGRCRHLGVSNFSAQKLGVLLETATIKPTVTQVELHPYLQQQALVDHAKAHGVVVTAYAPLGSPGRPEMFKRPEEPVLLEDPLIVDIAASLRCSPAQILLAWALARDTAVVVKSFKAPRLAENLAAVEISLSPEIMDQIAGLDRARRYFPADMWACPGSPYTSANIWDE